MLAFLGAMLKQLSQMWGQWKLVKVKVHGRVDPWVPQPMDTYAETLEREAEI